MRKQFSNIVFFSAALAMLAGAPALALKTGDSLPAFSATAADGKVYSPEKLKGKVVVMEWTNHGCPFVKKHYNLEYRNMQSLQERYTKNPNVVWLSVISSAPGKQGYVTAPEALKEQSEFGAHPTGILLDPKGELGNLFEAKTTPHMFVFDTNSKLVYQGAIDDKPSTETEDLKGAKNYVVAALDHVLDPKLAKQPLAVSSTNPMAVR